MQGFEFTAQVAEGGGAVSGHWQFQMAGRLTEIFASVQQIRGRPSMPKHYTLKAETGYYKLTVSEAKLAHKALVKNWWLIAAYLVVTLIGIVLSYFTSGFVSVVITTAVAIITFLVGLRMIQQVIRER